MHGADERRTVLITGCSPGGIGYALCCAFKAKGLRVFATARRLEDLASLEAKGIETLALTVDDPQSVQKCYAEIERRVGSRGLDYLVNNAGRSENYTVPAMEVDLQEARQLFETNFFAVILMSQTFLPLLLKAKGTIVQIGSVSGVMPYVFGSVYNASKAALHSLSDTMRIELAPFGVKVTTVITGGVQSRIAREDRQLAPDSLYQAILPEYNRRVQHSQEGAMTRDGYAKSVVAQILRHSGSGSYKKWIWEGNKSKLIRFFVGGWLWRKVKCDQKRPVCSRCHEGGFACVYSSSKKKPGPARGTRKAVRRAAKSPVKSAHSFVTSEQNDEHVSSFFSDIFVASPATGFQMDADAGFATGGGTSQPQSLLAGLTPLDPAAGPSVSSELGISPEMQAKLVHDFFDFVHYSMPLFRKDEFLQQYEDGTINRSILLTVLAVTAKSLGLPQGWQVGNIDDCLQQLLKNDPLDGPTQPALQLDAFRQSCLLAFYRFHQGHGGDAWDYISRISRKALRLGLHQLDSTDRYNSFDDILTTPANLEEWRYVWWCIYCFDSYSNIMAATPFVVEKESIRTALVATSLEGSSDICDGSPVKQFLPTDTRDLWRISAEMGARSTPASYFNMHIVTTTLLREAAAIFRLRRQSPSEGLHQRRSQLADHLSAVLLSLPPQFLREARNAFANESSVDHHARLVCLLHLHAARLLNTITFDPSDDSAWMTSWERSLAHSEAIVAVIREWDSRYCSTVDPAICLIVFCTLILLYLHEIHEATPGMPALSERLQAERNILLLFLEQFAKVWALPSSLKASFEKFTSVVHGPLSSYDIGRVLIQVPGHFRPWRGLLGLAPNPRDPLTPQEPGIDLSGLDLSFDFFSPL
ncbi:NADPH-dependent 1-acyldihydroxyacetone phosphate reductase [Aspergillus lentulus]|uniref:NADPH-dependent 1-acyldihydroxyacetone phosphate reductase n=1 Tax=Aspergillus lentulus TaxID=293939 RepID=A0AAN4PRP4_ASPLE|nr:NADPH-dependent 1-acyldihydroxyacetone phosphate reductase [Aspergillus lentulus]